MSKCQFCHQPIEGSLIVERNEKHYCCTGCATADEMLNGGDQLGPSAALVEKYAHLSLAEEGEGLEKFNATHQQWTVQLPAIHCTSCLILLERMGEWLPGVHDVRVSFSAKKATVQFNPQELSIALLAAWLDYVGYPPSLISQSKRNRNQIAQLGISGFAMGNAMMSAFPEYFGLNESGHAALLYFFRYSTAFFATISLLIAGRFYLENAYKAIRSAQWSLDIPIALGMLVLWFWSAYLILTGTSGGYFDSLSGLIFFLLLGRFLQAQTYEAFSFERTVQDFLPISVFSLNRQAFTRLADLQEGERIQIPTDGIIPAKCTTIAPAKLDYSFITGESDPQHISEGQSILPGGRNAGAPLQATVAEVPGQGVVEQLWKSNDREQTGWVSERITAIFTITVILAALTGGIIWYAIDPTRAAEIAVSVLIIACPCALSLAAPFAYGTASRFLSHLGLYFKSGIGLEKLANSTTFFWDKTGTLTHQSNAGNLSDLSAQHQSVLKAMTSRSEHPISQAISALLPQASPVELEQWESLPGQGIAAKFNGQIYRLGSAQWLQKPDGPTYFEKEGAELGYFSPVFSYREHLETMFEELTNMGAEHHLISGDSPRELPANWASYFDGKAHFNATPEQKAQIVNAHAGGVFLGDGLNDVQALEAADLGIAVVEGQMSYIPRSGGVLRSEMLPELPKMLRYAKKMIRWVRAAYILSLTYNVLGITVALLGWMSPVIAAILMPLSSISVVLFAVLGARLLRPKN